MLELNKIYNMDCFKFLEKIDNKIIDLAIIDPPYNMNKDGWDKFASQEAFFNFTYKWIDAVIPKLKDTGSLYVFNTPFNSAYILQYLIGKGLVFQNWITWDKRDGFSATKKRYINGQETILFFTKSKEHIFNADKIRVPYESEDRIKHAKIKGILKNGERWYPNPKGRLCSEVWHITSERLKNKVNGKTPKLPHATTKPLELIERIINASSNRGDFVLDCFMGSGTTAIASKELGRNFIGCDSNKDYVDIARKRLHEIEKQQKLR